MTPVDRQCQRTLAILVVTGAFYVGCFAVGSLAQESLVGVLCMWIYVGSLAVLVGIASLILIGYLVGAFCWAVWFLWHDFWGQ